jgi:hypothetical protein
MSDAIPGRAVWLLPTSGEPKQCNCASARAATNRIVGYGGITGRVIYPPDSASNFDFLPFAGAPTAQFSRGSLFPSDLISPKKA